MSDSTEGRVAIRYFAAKNKFAGCGWLPMITNNGRRCGNEYSPNGHSKEDAETLALAKAQEEALRYCGDWDITIERGEDGRT